MNTYTTNEHGQWIDEKGLWSILDFITARYQVGNGENPLVGEIDYNVKSSDGLLTERHYRTSFDAIGALQDGTITQEQFNTTNDTLRAIVKRSMGQHRQSVINYENGIVVGDTDE